MTLFYRHRRYWYKVSARLGNHFTFARCFICVGSLISPPNMRLGLNKLTTDKLSNLDIMHLHV